MKSKAKQQQIGLTPTDRAEIVNAKLVTLAPSVAQDMIIAAVPRFFISEDTIKRYLKGSVPVAKVQVGERLYAFLLKEVKKVTENIQSV